MFVVCSPLPPHPSCNTKGKENKGKENKRHGIKKIEKYTKEKDS